MASGEINVFVPPRHPITPLDERLDHRLNCENGNLFMIESSSEPDSLKAIGIGRVALVRNGQKISGSYHRIFAARAAALPDESNQVLRQSDRDAQIVLGYN